MSATVDRNPGKRNREDSMKPKRKPGRPRRKLKRIDASVEEITRRFFANAKPPDPSIRTRNRPK